MKHDQSDILLIGPLGAGKTTVGHLLAGKLGLPFCTVDNVRWEYFRKAGYDKTLASQIAASSQGIQVVLRYSKPFEAQMVEEILADHHGVIDFGASHTVYEYKVLFARVENALALCKAFFELSIGQIGYLHQRQNIRRNL